jgi:cobalt-zinc-cadmium efflux system outer membrane protein
VKSLFLVVCVLWTFVEVCYAQATKSISLHEAITMGLESHPDILQAFQEITSAKGRILQAGKIQNPELGISFNEVPSGYKVSSANEKDISFTQSFEYPAKRSGRISVATLDEQRAVAVVQQLKARIAANIKKAYIDAQYAGIVVHIIEQQITLLRDFTQIVSNKYKTGESTYLDVLRMEIETASLQNELLDAQKNNLSMQTILKNNISDSTAVLYIPMDSLYFTPMSSNKDSLISSLFARSHTRKIAEMLIRREESRLSLAKTNYYPDFGLGLAYQQRTPSSSFLGVELKVSVPLWYWQEPQGITEEASAQLSIAEIQMLSIERRIRNNISSAFVSVQASEQQVKNYEQVLQKGLTEIMDVAMAQFRNNQIDLLNLFDIYRLQRKTRAEYIRSVANHRRAVAELESAAETSID